MANYYRATSYHGVVTHMFTDKLEFYPKNNGYHVRSLCGRNRVIWYRGLSHMPICKNCYRVAVNRLVR